MNIHLAGTAGFLSKDIWGDYPNYLETFSYFLSKSKQSQDKKVEKFFKLLPLRSKVILDSGAYSIANGSVKFTVRDYIDFLHTHGSKFFRYISLDLIVFSDSPLVIQTSIEETQNNLSIIESEGLIPIPVYQRKWNDFSLLEKLLEKYDYICIGGLVNGKISDPLMVQKTLDKVFELNSKYKKKIHGLGVTDDILLKKYPFYSVDSTSWLVGATQRIQYIPKMDKYIREDIGRGSFEKSCIPTPGSYEGYPTPETLNYPTRLKCNISFFNKYQSILSTLWKERGIKWEG